MRPITFYRAALLLPVIIPLLLWALAEWVVVSDADAELAVFFMFSLFYAGLPYLFFAGGLAWWMRDKASAEVRRIMLRAPVLFIPVAWTGNLILSALAPEYGGGGLGWLLIMGSAVLFVGYTYVGILEAARWLGERFGLFEMPGTAR